MNPSCYLADKECVASSCLKPSLSSSFCRWANNLTDFLLFPPIQSDPGDAFNQFWNIMQGMLDNLSQPVAFATIPLGPETPASPASDRPSPELRRDGNLSSDTDPDEPIFSKFSRKIGLGNKNDR